MASAGDLISYPGIILGVIAAAAALWALGVRDEFILTALALIVGGTLGGLAERAIAKRLWPDPPNSKQHEE
ncbi:MAG TPA: hypothetical protein VEK57_14735 [Thermoanaerobaculia bacterium]|nr:hypothetical protein [Thermoanaerobaculia bacterium]